MTLNSSVLINSPNRFRTGPQVQISGFWTALGSTSRMGREALYDVPSFSMRRSMMKVAQFDLSQLTEAQREELLYSQSAIDFWPIGTRPGKPVSKPVSRSAHTRGAEAALG
jgi:hypothetical protein